jgi:hypothetical protein
MTLVRKWPHLRKEVSSHHFFLPLLLLSFKVVKTHNCEDLVLKDLHQDNTPKQL